MASLSQRQQRELRYFDEFARGDNHKEISFDPVLGKERRPWNPYWYVYEYVARNFRHDGQKLLDVGCGPGISSIRFAKIGYEVWGFDLSPAQIDIAERTAKHYGFENRTHFSVEVAEELSYPSDFFEMIVGMNILHHVDIRRAVGECHRLLKKDGIAIFKEPVEAPVFDRIRGSRIGLFIVPKSRASAQPITEDEKKLTLSDISTIGEIFPTLSEKRFTCFSRVDEFIRNPGSRSASFLEKMDHLVFRIFPFMRGYGGNVVLIMKK